MSYHTTHQIMDDRQQGLEKMCDNGNFHPPGRPVVIFLQINHNLIAQPINHCFLVL